MKNNKKIMVKFRVTKKQFAYLKEKANEGEAYFVVYIIPRMNK